jgi:adenine/guanine phosphoribosyltransferase-like PRPP-binding protein
VIHATCHLGLTDLPAVVARTCEQLTPHLAEFDSITTEGISGLVVAAPVAVQLGKPLVIVRTERDAGGRCFHASDVEGARAAGRKTLFLDDHIHLGRTLMHACHLLRRHAPATGIWATYQYETGDLVPL